VCPSEKRGKFVGDHDKPTCSLKAIEEKFYKQITVGPSSASSTICDETLRNIRFGFLEHQDMQRMAERAASGSYGEWVGGMIRTQSSPPNLLGISLLHAGQVIPSVAISMIARDIWPNVTVAWGGPHISGLGQVSLQAGLQDRQYAADIFVSGHAEQTFVELLDDLSSTDGKSGATRKPCFCKGYRGRTPLIPSFDNLSLYDAPPVLPAQSTLGCAYGRCAFCTYPKMEPVPSKLDLSIAVQTVVERASEVNGTVSLKDSLVTPKRLKEIASVIQGRVRWSACTKLHPKLVDDKLLHYLTENGLATLEVGLESLLVETQRRVAKVHRPNLFEDFLKTVEVIPELSIVINYMTGFPWEAEQESLAGLDRARCLARKYLGVERGKVEHNEFELERQSPMAHEPEKYGICSKTLKYWPWASIVEYERK
jgi:hypothetical protein